ncbi:hypothetical protein MCG98_09700 [Ruminococcus sp. OA3]|uniref:hypothetical protein n=1 Tax=Ruminococcus sp. OA3 TaxID=2914164 RepID=UPI001F0572A3|nr:hypothetical protein [Ruminococcus sp. OA3]MCH1982838.1 hypothetical protein [Ruminococcus sp. OA3]
MKIPEKWAGKIVFAVQAVLVLVYVLFTFWQDISEKRKRARKVQRQEEKEAVRYTKAKYRLKRKNLKKRK